MAVLHLASTGAVVAAPRGDDLPSAARLIQAMKDESRISNIQFFFEGNHGPPGEKVSAKTQARRFNGLFRKRFDAAGSLKDRKSYVNVYVGSEVDSNELEHKIISLVGRDRVTFNDALGRKPTVRDIQGPVRAARISQTYTPEFYLVFFHLLELYSSSDLIVNRSRVIGREIANDVDCIRYDQYLTRADRESHKTQRSFWLDPVRGHNVIRYVEYVNRKKATEIDCRDFELVKAQDGRSVWLPMTISFKNYFENETKISPDVQYMGSHRILSNSIVLNAAHDPDDYSVFSDPMAVNSDKMKKLGQDFSHYLLRTRKRNPTYDERLADLRAQLKEADDQASRSGGGSTRLLGWTPSLSRSCYILGACAFLSAVYLRWRRSRIK